MLNNRSASLARKQRNTGGGTSCDTNAYIAIGWPTMFATVLHVTEASQKVMNATCGPYPWHDTTARPLYLQVRKSPGIRDESLQALTVRALLEQRSPMASRTSVAIAALSSCLALRNAENAGSSRKCIATRRGWRFKHPMLKSQGRLSQGFTGSR